MSRKTVSYDPSCDIVTITAVATCYVFSCIGFNFFYLNVCYSAPDRRAEYCDERVCLSVCVCVFVCPRAYLRNCTSDLHQSFCSRYLVTYGCGSVLLWWHSDMLCTFGLMDDAIFAYKPMLLDVPAQLKLSAHASLGLAVNCAQ